VPDDVTARQLESLGKLIGKMDRLLDKVEKEAAAAQETRNKLDALDKKVTSYIDEDRAVRKAQLALVDARAELARQFGHYEAVRRRATGMLRAMTTETVGPVALLRAAEQLMVDAYDYWLAPAQVALAAWVADSQAGAEHAVREALCRDRSRSALLFSLVLARSGRPDAAARWITEYARAQDPSALTAEFPAVLDAVARGALGAPARERLLDACRDWRDQLGDSGDQVASWTDFVRDQRQPLTNKFPPLGTVGRDWAVTRSKLEAATAFGHTEQWIKDRLAGTSEDEEKLRTAADGLLRELISAPDPAEDALLAETSRSRAIIENGGHPPTPPSGERGETDFLSLATAIATGTHPGQPAAQTARFCLVLSRASVERAVTDLSQHVSDSRPASIEVTIEGWHHAIEPGDDPEALVQSFLGWAHETLTEDKAQAARKRLSMGRLPARLEQIESRWERISRAGQEIVYDATAQANRFFQRWQHELAAAGRCVELLQAQSAAEAADTVPSPVSEPAVKLPDWDLEPP
jgi:hypothetical protein